MLEDDAFSNCNNLEEITIPGSANAFRVYNVFRRCNNLKSIIIGNGYTEIKDNMFERMYTLEKVSLPNTISEIGNNAFSGCSTLKEINIPSSVKTIGDRAFEGCESIEEINIPNGVTSIGEWAFGSCNSLKEIIIPNSVTTISDGAFSFCENLTSIVMGDGITKISRSMFNMDNLQTIVIGKNVEEIEEFAFGWHKNLREITISNKLKIIGDCAFVGCTGLTTVNYTGTEEEWEEVELNSGDYNGALFNATINYISVPVLASTKTYVSDDGKSFEVTPINIATGNTVILALYNGTVFVEMQSALYDGETMHFTTTKAYTNAKVMVWDNLTNLKPVCDVEVVK